MISFRNFALRRGERLLLSNVDLALQSGWRVGENRGRAWEKDDANR